MKLENYWGREGVLVVDVISIELSIPFYMINIYGPFHNCEVFWEDLMPTSIVNNDNIIIGGDLNFSLGHVQYWGNQS